MNWRLFYDKNKGLFWGMALRMTAAWLLLTACLRPTMTAGYAFLFVVLALLFIWGAVSSIHKLVFVKASRTSLTTMFLFGTGVIFAAGILVVANGQLAWYYKLPVFPLMAVVNLAFVTGLSLFIYDKSELVSEKTP